MAEEKLKIREDFEHARYWLEQLDGYRTAVLKTVDFWRMARSRGFYENPNDPYSALNQLYYEAKESATQLPRVLTEYNDVAKFATLADYADYLEDTIEEGFKEPFEKALAQVENKDSYQGMNGKVIDCAEELFDMVERVLGWAKNIKQTDLYEAETSSFDTSVNEQGSEASQTQQPQQIKPVKKSKKRSTKAEMGNRNKAIAMAAAKFKAEYDRLPTVDEIIAETKYTRNQIYATNAYTEGKIAKPSAKLTAEMTGNSITTSEQFSEKSIQHSRTDRRTKSEQDELNALIDQQKKDCNSDFAG